MLISGAMASHQSNLVLQSSEEPLYLVFGILVFVMILVL